MTRLHITWTKSGIGYAQDQKDTIRVLGLHKLHDSVDLPDTPTTRGMVRKVQHLITVTTVEDPADE